MRNPAPSARPCPVMLRIMPALLRQSCGGLQALPSLDDSPKTLSCQMFDGCASTTASPESHRRPEPGDVGEVAVALVPVQAVPHHEDVRDLSADVVGTDFRRTLPLLGEESAHLERRGISRPEV